MKTPFHKSFFDFSELHHDENTPHHLVRRRKAKKYAFGGVFFVGSLSLVYAFVGLFVGPLPTEKIVKADTETLESKPLVVSTEIAPVMKPTHVKIPDAVKAIYMSACVAATPSIRERVLHIANTTEINSIVVDIKDFSGIVSYESTDSKLQQDPGPRSCRIRDIQGLTKLLHDNNIYIIGRIAVFQDPYFVDLHPELAVKRASDGEIWRDRKGIPWLDAGSKVVWDHVIEIARDAYAQGFDEINFDYIRYPADGNMRDIAFPISHDRPKDIVVKEFYEYLGREMKTSGITTSADLFGMTTTNNDDLNIGQILENALLNFDYVAPMVYPSHYPDHFNGWDNPNAHPYDLIKFVMSAGAEKALKASTTPLKLRPWLQDFSMGQPRYGKTEVEAQIQATYDAGLTSWMLWDPSNKYAGGALLRE